MLANIHPNQITASRLLLTPIAIILFLLFTPLSLVLCLMITLVIESLDKLDGYVARKYNKVSDVGKLLDPMCDAIFHLSMFITISHFLAGPIAIFFIVGICLILFREIFVAYLRSICALQGLVLAARSSGKLKAVIQMVAVCLMIVVSLLTILTVPMIWISSLNLIAGSLFLLAIIMSFISLFDYLAFASKNLDLSRLS